MASSMSSQYQCTECLFSSENLQVLVQHNCLGNLAGMAGVMSGVFHETEQPRPQLGALETEMSQPESQQKSFKWDDNHVKLLIEGYGQFKHLLKKGKTKKDVFQKICAHFNETSESKVTVDQCIRKWDKLLAKFKQVEDNNKHTGNARQTCKFYDSLQECIGESPIVNPRYTFDVARVASSSSSQSESNTEICEGDGDTLEGDESDNSLKGAKDVKKRVRKRKSQSSAAEMLTFLQGYSEKREKVEEQKIALLREMHQEKKEFFTQFLDVLKKK